MMCTCQTSNQHPSAIRSRPVLSPGTRPSAFIAESTSNFYQQCYLSGSVLSTVLINAIHRSIHVFTSSKVSTVLGCTQGPAFRGLTTETSEVFQNHSSWYLWGEKGYQASPAMSSFICSCNSQECSILARASNNLKTHRQTSTGQAHRQAQSGHIDQ